MKYDFVIVGGGLSGSILAYTLSEKYRQNILLIDNNLHLSSSIVAAGIFNPITGKKPTKTWMADVLFPFLHDFYPAIETHLQTHFFYSHHVFKPFDSIADQNNWMAKSAEHIYKNYILLLPDTEKWNNSIRCEFGGMEINYSGWLDCEGFIMSIKQYLLKKKAYLNTIFDPEGYKSERIIYCEGFQAAINPLWNWLPWNLTKGEVLVIENGVLGSENIINKSAFLCPTTVPGKFKAGSTYAWDKMDNIATEKAREDITQRIGSFLKVNYAITGQEAGVRPTVERRRPFLGKHPKDEKLFIFNGFGSKTVSIAPYFALEMAEFILNNKKVDPEVDIERYYPIQL